MNRIAGTLAANGYRILLVGRNMKGAPVLQKKGFAQKRLYCPFQKGPFFYLCYNVQLFFYLLFQRADLICAIDLDTILPVYFVTMLKNQKRVYDAHELFTEQKEVITRKLIHRCWLAIEKFAVPRFQNGYTVNGFIADELHRRYGVTYQVIRNLPFMYPLPAKENGSEKWIIYQGSVNEGRCFETLVPAMQLVDAQLVICGQGNFLAQTKALVKQYGLSEKVIFKGPLLPEAIQQLTPKAYFGLTLFEKTGLNQFQSLSNRFFDYLMAGIPQLCVNYPEYAAINDQYGFAYMVSATDSGSLAAAMNNLLADTVLYDALAQQCLKSRSLLNWETEKLILLKFYEYL
jgi:glycosyltransferase involved in cell wall biosynthesis